MDHEQAFEAATGHGGGEVRLEATIASKVNFALYQNAVPVLRDLVIVNNSPDRLDDLQLAVSCDPPILRPRNWRIEELAPSSSYHLTDLDVALDGALLGRLTEAESGEVTFDLSSRGVALARLTKPLDLLARNQWGGIGHVPELLAAFVQPNDRAVERVLKEATAVLRSHGKSPALDGYMEGPVHAWDVASAVWTAVGGLGLDYSLPPASFEQTGQKIRGPSQVIEGGLATCLDTTILFCSALEQCGLNPVAVITHGHSFAGVWLQPEEFATPVVDDITALRKSIQLNEMVLFETTLATQRPCPSFKTALFRGAQQVADAAQRPFELAIDIRRARIQRIRPLSGESFAPAAQEAAEGSQAAPPEFEEAPEFILDTQGGSGAEQLPETPEGRLQRWQRRLLDLSLRNNLLNFRPTKRSMKMEAPDPAGLEDRLCNGPPLRLRVRPNVMDGFDPRSSAIHEARSQEDVRSAYALDALKNGELFVDLGQEEVDLRLTELYRTARASLQEGGANILYLAFGFLAWTRDGKDNRRYRAPLILVPVTLNRRSARSGFTLGVHDDEPRFNPTLLEMLRQDLKLDLPVAHDEFPRDDHGVDVRGVWRAVSEAVKDIRGWEVVEEVVLATFSFAKYLMWKDLVDRTDQLKENPVVCHLIETPHEAYPAAVGFVEPSQLDVQQHPGETFCPLPVDSSQLSAVIAGARGQDFVLLGPPGTGKSQTIANLIAQCLGEKRTVLFVSEKMAALDVVYRRLREIGLADYCLELHSNKAKKAEVLAQLRTAWEARSTATPEEWEAEAQRLFSLRERLNRFVQRLHQTRRNGLSAYRAIGMVVARRALPDLRLSWPSAEIHDREAYTRLLELADRLELNAQQVGDIEKSPLAPITHADWSPAWQTSLLRAAEDLAGVAHAFGEAVAAIRAATGIAPESLDKDGREGLGLLAQALPLAAERDWRFALGTGSLQARAAMTEAVALVKKRRDLAESLSGPWENTTRQGLMRGLGLINRAHEVDRALSDTYTDAVSALDPAQLAAGWNAAEGSWWLARWNTRRQITSKLKQVTRQGKDPQVLQDLQRLVELAHLKIEISELSWLTASSGGVWRGIETLEDTLREALAFQAQLTNFRAAGRLDHLNFPGVAAGTCGNTASEDLHRLVEIARLDELIHGFDGLREQTRGLWSGLATDIQESERFLAFHDKLRDAQKLLARSPEESVALHSALEGLLGAGNGLLRPGGVATTALQRYPAALAAYDAASAAFSTQSGRGSPEQALYDCQPERAAGIARGVVGAQGGLRAWCAWRRAREEAVEKGLAPVIVALESGTLAPGTVREVFETAYARWWLNATVDDDEVLRTFVPAEHERDIRDFRTLDSHLMELCRSYVRARIYAELPSQSGVSRLPEWGVLNYQMQLKRPRMPLRRLIEQIPNALAKLAPCLLMSPLSIAQYLSPAANRFDLVVFDEASQIPVWEAVGAIARGAQVVMVGDQKQLPPTSFFERSTNSNDEIDALEDVEEDLESILDECIGAGLPPWSLRWHYRSRHESLIAFSNHYYYDDSLVTFPSPVTDDRAVSFHPVPDGVYEKGGARVNRSEARSLVADLVARLKDPTTQALGLTMGVVTFNAEQQRLIEDLLDAERRKSPELERHFQDDRLEPVFVKNLENVQGDERDIMYFSVTYGPDAAGAVSMNFGPLNRDGGERRLNVAITRARHELRVFSSLRAEHMDLSRTMARGVRDFKHFLEFAERGPRALAEVVIGVSGEHESPLERAIAGALSEKGWTLHAQVGVSSLRIDLGVVDPDAPGRYLCGIECDGATYHRSATARDRDKLREHVLRSLGWEVVRVWSTDWWQDPEGTLERTHGRLVDLLETRRKQRVVERVTSHQAVEPAETASLPRLEPALPSPVREGHRDQMALWFDEVSRETGEHPVGPVHDEPALQAMDASALSEQASAELFFESSYDKRLQDLIKHVVEVEGPIREDILARRIARAHGWERAGGRIRERVIRIALKTLPHTQEEVGTFVWPAGSDVDRLPGFRRPVEGTARSSEEVAFPELVALAQEIRSAGVSEEDAPLAMARCLGLQRLRAASRQRLQRAWIAARGR